MKLLKSALVALLVTSRSSAAAAGDLHASAANAARAAARDAGEQAPMPSGGSSGAKTTMVLGSALFVGGFAVGLYGFLDNKNGKDAEFGEASARNVHLGAAGLGTAFAGGVVMLMGSHARHLPSVSAGSHQLSVTKRLAW